MSRIAYQEEWVIRVGDKDFIVDKNQKDKVLEAMRQGKRFVPIIVRAESDPDIISTRHINYMYLSSKRIANQLPRGEDKEYKPLVEEKLRKIKEEIYARIGRL